MATYSLNDLKTDYNTQIKAATVALETAMRRRENIADVTGKTYLGHTGTSYQAIGEMLVKLDAEVKTFKGVPFENNPQTCN